MRRLLLLVVLVLLSTCLVACRNPRRTKRPSPPTAGAAGSQIHADYWTYDPMEIAVERPRGEATAAFRLGLREGLYQEALANDYAVLAPDYVDAADLSLTGLSGPSVLRSEVTGLRRRSDGWLLSGWASLHCPTPEGGEVLYVMELTDFFVRRDALPLPDRRPDAGQREAGKRLGRALLSQLPRR